MEITVEKPHTPFLWLDTHAVSTLVREDELAKAILDLRESGKLLVVETDQLVEIQPRPELVEPIRDLLTRLSQSQRSHFQQPREVQLQLGMKAYIEGSSELHISWETAFVEDPFKDRSVGGLWIRADIPSTPEQIAALRQGNQHVAQEMEGMRQELLSGGKSEANRYEEQLEKELKGRANLFLQIMAKLLAGLEDGSLSVDDVLTSLDLAGAPMAFWKRLGGKAGPAGLLEFYESDVYRGLPFVAIWSRLAATKLSGGEVIRPSDIMDMNNIAAFLPYAHYMVLDRAMIDKVKKLGLDTAYGTEVLRLNELSGVLEGLTDAAPS